MLNSELPAALAGSLVNMLVVVAVALFDRDGRVLMQQRPIDRQHGGLWEFPGGKVEAGEGPIAALLREIIEELQLGMEAQDLFPIGFASDEIPGSRPITLLLFGCRRWTGNPIGEPGAVLSWVDPADMRQLSMPPLDIPLAAMVESLTK